MIILGACTAIAVQACSSGPSKKSEGVTTLAEDTTIHSGTTGKVKNDTSSLRPDERTFVQQAAVGGMMEVEAGNLTTQKTKDQKIMAYAKQMIADHNKIGAELKQISGKMGIELPSQLPAAEQGNLAKLRQMQAREYDENYMDMMVMDHSRTIDLFNGARTFKNADLQAFAVRTLPLLQKHQKMAMAIDTLFKTKKPDNNGDDLPNVDKNRKN